MNHLASPIRVLIAEDHHVVRQGLRAYLRSVDDIEVIGEVGDGPALQAFLEREQPDILLMDVEMPEHQPIELVGWLAEQYPDVQVLVLSAYTLPHYVVSLFRCGVAGYVIKDDPAHVLIDALRAVRRGDGWISPQVAKVLAEELRDPGTSGQDQLSDREREILVWVGRGRSNAVIAEELVLSENTVRNHIARIYQKLDVSSRVEAVVAALRSQIIALDELAEQNPPSLKL